MSDSAVLWAVDLQAPPSTENLAWDSPGKNTGVGCHFLLQDQLYLNLKRSIGDFPGGSVVESPPSSVGNVGSMPGQRTGIPQAAGQLGLHALAEEPGQWNY